MPNPGIRIPRTLLGDFDKEGGATSSGWLKFAIGVFAGVCAVFLPKMLVFLIGNNNADLKFVSAQYVLIGLAFAVLVGLGVLVFEWRKFSKPGDVFMMALGFPAIVSGALTTAGTVDQLRRADETVQSTTAKAAALAQIPISETPVVAPKRGAAVGLIPAAHAADGIAPVVLAQTRGGFGVQVVPRKYLVVLEETGSEAQAAARVQALKSQFPAAAVVKSGAGFLVTTDAHAVPEDKALDEALALRSAGNLKPSLVRVRD